MERTGQAITRESIASAFREIKERELFTFNASNGTVSLPGSPFVKGSIRFSIDDFTCVSEEMKWKKGRVCIAQYRECELSVAIRVGHLVVGVLNRGKKGISLHDIRVTFRPSECRPPLLAGRYYECISDAGLVASGVKKVGLANRWIKNNPESSNFYVLKEMESDISYLFARIPPISGDVVTFQALHDAAHLEGGFGVEITCTLQRLLKPHQRAFTSPLYFEQGNNPLQLLENLGEIWHRQLGNALKPIKRGWNSWDFFSGAVAPKDIYANQKAAKKLFGESLDHFIIDEGYEPRWGVWDANWKFSEGLPTFCRRIKAMGGKPGIWTAPLLVNMYTDTYRNHPEWFARASDGQIADKMYGYGPMAFLDPTHPEAAEFLCSIYRNLQRAGFNYFKIDFCQEILVAQIFHDRTVPRGGLIRRAFELIRKTLGKDAYILSCGAPFEAVAGLVDAVRICGDIHNFWSHVQGNAYALASHWWMHRRLWNNDPDFLIVRSPDTCPGTRLNREYRRRPFQTAGFWFSGREFNLEEAKTYALLIYLSGGEMILGDDLGSLNHTGAQLLRRVLDEPLTQAAKPLDLFSHHDRLPSLWLAHETNFQFLGVFNWEEDPVSLHLDLDGMGLGQLPEAQTFWEGRRLRIADKTLNVNLPPRSAVGFRFDELKKNSKK